MRSTSEHFETRGGGQRLPLNLGVMGRKVTEFERVALMRSMDEVTFWPGGPSERKGRQATG